MMENTLCNQFLRELESEVNATRKCLERIPQGHDEWKPHEKSMKMGYLTLLAASMPRWIWTILEKGEIDFATYPQPGPMTPAQLLSFFDESVELARDALKKATDEGLKAQFELKNQGQLLMSDSKLNSVSSSLNHWVHHRGQLTVYMRLNNIPVPSIYGPSADDKTF